MSAGLALVLVVAVGCSALGTGSVDRPAPTDRIAKPAATSVVSPIPRLSPIPPAPPAMTPSASSSRPGPSVESSSTEAAAAKGCGPAAVPPLDDEFVPYEGQLSHTLFGPSPIRSTNAKEATVDEVRRAGLDMALPQRLPAGRSLQLLLLEDAERVWATAYFRAVPIGSDETIDDFFATGGILLQQVDPGGSDAADVQQTVGERAILIEIGSHPAALVYGDEFAPGVRLLGLYWSDGIRDLSVEAGHSGTDPAELIDLARAIYCTG